MIIFDDDLYVHLTTGLRGTIFWEANGTYGKFQAENGAQFTIHKTEVITLQQLKEAAA